MPSIYRPRRPRASPLWQIVHTSWADFRAGSEACPPKSQQTIRYYGIYSNKTRGMVAKTGETANRSREGGSYGAKPSTPEIIPAPARHAACRSIRTLWRELIRRVWGADRHICPCRSVSWSLRSS